MYEFQLMTITPEDAQGILQNRFFQNRPIRDGRARKLAVEITAGRWCVNGETIIFTGDGKLLDGQHRIRAVVLAQKPIQTFAVYGVHSDAFSSIDDGLPRSAADIATMCGMKYANLVSSAANVLIRYLSGSYDARCARPSNRTMVEVLKNNGGLVNSAPIGKSLSFLLPARIAVFCHYLLSTIGPELANTMFEQLRSGENIGKGNPVYALRERLFRMVSKRTSRQHLHQDSIYILLMFKTWNYCVEGKRVVHLVVRPNEQIPEPFEPSKVEVLYGSEVSKLVEVL